jgi:hypothetical protein
VFSGNGVDATARKCSSEASSKVTNAADAVPSGNGVAGTVGGTGGCDITLVVWLEDKCNECRSIVERSPN